MIQGTSWMLATVCFILGVGIIFLLDYIVHKISPDAAHTLDVEELNVLSHSPPQPNSIEVSLPRGTTNDMGNSATRQSLNRTGILTALAIAIHNLPEGVATFMAAIQKLELGVALAFSIALHNIPEGVAVAAPVYFATGSRVKAFAWTFLSALAEPLGGILCWSIKRIQGKEKEMDPIVNGVMFGLVVGMMVTISFKELIPTAHRFSSSKDKLTVSIIVGMCIMALSLILAAYAGLHLEE